MTTKEFKKRTEFIKKYRQGTEARLRLEAMLLWDFVQHIAAKNSPHKNQAKQILELKYHDKEPK